MGAKRLLCSKVGRIVLVMQGILLLLFSSALAQLPGSVDSFQKISDTVGNFTGTLADGDQFGYAVADLGTVLDDGNTPVRAIAVGAPGTSTNEGAVWILFLDATGNVTSHVLINGATTGLTALAAGDRFGSSITALGDVDGTSASHLAIAVGSPGDNSEGDATAKGAIWFIFLDSAGDVVAAPAPQRFADTDFTGALSEGDQFGASLTFLGDLAGAGSGNFALGIGAPGNDEPSLNESGAVWIGFFNATTPASIASSDAEKISDTNGGFPTGQLATGDFFGSSVAFRGSNEIWVGAPGANGGGTDRGAVFTMNLDTDGTLTNTPTRIGDASGGFGGTLLDNANLGTAAATLGGDIDVDGNGTDDSAVGANCAALTPGPGAVWVLFNDTTPGVVGQVELADGINGIPTSTLGDDDSFGSAIAPLGNLDGLKAVDMAAGAPGDDDGGAGTAANRGAVYILFLELGPAEPCACATGAEPGQGTADLILGTPDFAFAGLTGNEFAIPIRANISPADNVTTASLTVEYNSSCMTFKRHAIATTGDVITEGVFEPTVPTSLLKDSVNKDSRVIFTVVFDSDLNGCDQTLMYAIFELDNDQSGCDVDTGCITWDDRDPGGLPLTVLETSATAPNDQIRPGDIEFCGIPDCPILCPNPELTGNIVYYAGGFIPDVTVDDVTNSPSDGPIPSDNDPDYTLMYANGPRSATVCAARASLPDRFDPLNGFGITVKDVQILEDFIGSGSPPCQVDTDLDLDQTDGFTLQQFRAANVTRDVWAASPTPPTGCSVGDEKITLADPNRIRGWLQFETFTCDYSLTDSESNNCTGHWEFDFQVVTASGVLANGPAETTPERGTVNTTTGRSCRTTPVTLDCDGEDVDVVGLLLGDPNGTIFATKPRGWSGVDLQLTAGEWDGDEISVGLSADVSESDPFWGLLFSMTFDPDEVEYLGMTTGLSGADWRYSDNAEHRGVVHGVVTVWNDAMHVSGEKMRWRFRALNPDAASHITFSRVEANDLMVDDIPAIEISKGDRRASRFPAAFRLSAAPNPFNPRTRVEVSIPETSGMVPVVLDIYDVAGRRVRTLLHGQRGPGRHALVWDGTDNNGNSVRSGIYMIRASAGEWSEIEKVTLLK